MVTDIKTTIRKYLVNFDNIYQKFKTIPARSQSPRCVWGEMKVRINGHDFYKVSDEIISEIDDIFRGATMEELYPKSEYSSRDYYQMLSLLDKAASGWGIVQYDYFNYTDLTYFYKELVRRCENVELKKMIIQDFPDILGTMRPMPISEELLQHILDYKLLNYMTYEPYKKTLLKHANDDQKAEILYYFMSVGR